MTETVPKDRVDRTVWETAAIQADMSSREQPFLSKKDGGMVPGLLHTQELR